MEMKYIQYDELNNEDMTIIDKYDNYEFDDYYYNDKTDKFYADNGAEYRELYINFDRNGNAFINVLDKHYKPVKLYINKFKRIRDFTITPNH